MTAVKIIYIITQTLEKFQSLAAFIMAINNALSVIKIFLRSRELDLLTKKIV